MCRLTLRASWRRRFLEIGPPAHPRKRPLERAMNMVTGIPHRVALIEGGRLSDVQAQTGAVWRSMIRSKSVPAGRVPNARPQSPPRREAQKASATAGSA